MRTVVDAPARAPALKQGGLIPCALHFVQVNAATALSKLGTSTCRNSVAASQLPAHNLGITEVPAVITHRAPAPILVDLNAPLTSVPAVHQAQRATWESREQGKLLTKAAGTRAPALTDAFQPHTTFRPPLLPTSTLLGCAFACLRSPILLFWDSGASLKGIGGVWWMQAQREPATGPGCSQAQP